MMKDDGTSSRREHRFATRLSHAGRAGTRVHGFVNPPVMRGSTVLYPSCADRIALGKKRLEQELIYGVLGGPAHGATPLLDHTWGIHFCQPFEHGVNVSIQALTKYVVGHSDVLLGSVTTNDPADWERVRNTALALGQYASPDDCWLALRGVRTMAVRLERQMRAGIEIARWFAVREEVAQVLHPALEGAPGHALWKRDFSGACSLFGVVFKP